MARNKGTFDFSANFEPKIEAPLDARQVVDNQADLINPATWEDEDNLIWLYNGAIVSVANDPAISKRGIYIILDAANYTDINNWQKAGSATDTSILNVGDGSAGVYKGTDSSGNILLRTIKGSGAATVTQTTEEIVIGLDASFSGEVNFGDNVGTGDVSIYSEKSGDALRFRTIKGGKNIDLSYSDPLTISIDVSGLSDASILTSKVEYDPSLNATLEMPKDVGGLVAGTTVADLDGDSVRTILNDMLFPTVEPTYQNPDNTFSGGSVNSYYEVNSIIAISFTSILNRGKILLNGIYQDFRSGLANSYFYTDPSANTLLDDVSTSISPNIQTIGGYKVIEGNQTWTSKIAYDEGPQPLDNKGNPVDSPWSAGTTTAKSVTIAGVYPIFATTVDINTLTQQSLISMNTTTGPEYPLVAETGGAKHQFEIPDKWTNAPNNNPLTGVQTYNTVSGAWEYEGGNAIASLALWPTGAITNVIQGITENYTQYTYNGVDRGAISIRLIF